MHLRASCRLCILRGHSFSNQLRKHFGYGGAVLALQDLVIDHRGRFWPVSEAHTLEAAGFILFVGNWEPLRLLKMKKAEANKAPAHRSEE